MPTPGEFVLDRSEDVLAALASTRLSVAPAGASSGAAGRLQARMARFSDGARHASARAAVEELLADLDGLEQAACDLATDLLVGVTGSFDAMPLARTVPVGVLARALGVEPVHIPGVVTLTGQLCDALAPRLENTSSGSAGDGATRDLVAVMRKVPWWDEEMVTAAISVLFQARDATAALIGAALLGSGQEFRGDPGSTIEATLRAQPPVRCTRRVATDDVVLGSLTVPRGAGVWVMLCPIETGPPAPPATFGRGPHSCPGARHAVELAGGALSALHQAGWRVVAGQQVSYEPRPNLRMPSHVMMHQP